MRKLDQHISGVKLGFAAACVLLVIFIVAGSYELRRTATARREWVDRWGELEYNATPTAPLFATRPAAGPGLPNTAGGGAALEATAIEEAGRPDESRSRELWLNSGGRFYYSGLSGQTVFGELPPNDPWREAYAVANPVDTDQGAHPQNIFRLLSRDQFINSTQEAYFTIRRDNLSASPNRNESNGLLFLSRYQDSNNLYYAGLRVDGHAVIKKKRAGVYQTLKLVPIIAGAPYDRAANPNLLPHGQPLGLRLVTEDEAGGGVRLRLWLDLSGRGEWLEAATAVDQSEPLAASGLVGIRTDFMDVEIGNYRFGGR